MDLFSFSEEELGSYFPYHVSVNNKGKIASFGSNLPNVCGIRKGLAFTDYFLMSTADSGVVFPVIQLNTVVTLEPVDAPQVKLVGKFHYLSENEVYLFLGNPNYLPQHKYRSEGPANAGKDAVADLLLGRIDCQFETLADAAGYFAEMGKQWEADGEQYAVTVSDEQGSVVWCNDYFAAKSGHSKEEIIGKRPRDAIYGKRSIFISKNFVDDNIRLGKPFYFENIGYTKNVGEFWFGVTVCPIYTRGGNVIGRVHLLKDITAQKIKEIKDEEDANILKLAIDAASAGIWSYDISSEELKMSAYYLKMLGKPTDTKMTAGQLTDLIHPDDMDYFRTVIFKNVSRDNPFFTFEHRVLLDSGGRYFNVRGKCIQWGSNDEPVKLVGTVRDITNDKNNILELERQKKFYHDILDRIPADIALWTPEHKYIFANKSSIRNNDVRQWIIGKDDFDYCALKGMPLSFAKARRSHFNKAMASQNQSNHIERIGTDGQEKYVLRVYYPLIDSDGNTELVIGYGVDISDQILNERYARQQEKRVKNIFEISRDGLFLMDEQGEVLTRNSSLLAILGLRTTSSKKINFIKLLDEQTQPEFLQKLKEVSRTKTVQSGTFDYLCRQSGQLKVLDYSVVPLAMATEKGYIVRVSDITEIVNKERNLEQTVAKEKQLNNYKSQFMRITSHELRTPLTIILANTEILQIIQKDPAMGTKINPDDLTNKIVKEVHIMIEILNQLMIVNKIETGDIELQKEQIDIEAYITDLVKDFFSPAPDGRELTVHIAPDLGEWQLDGKLLKYALINILGNAFKYSHQRVSPILWVSEVDDGLEFRVKDFGIGIPENEVGSLFTSFFRASNVGTISGTGIGLMVVEYAVKRHQGTIAIHSVLKKGTEIVINIPRKT